MMSAIPHFLNDISYNYSVLDYFPHLKVASLNLHFDHVNCKRIQEKYPL